MSVSITIRDVPSEVRDELAARAAQSGRSLQEYLSFELRELAARPNMGAALREIRSRARAYPRTPPEVIRENLETDRR